MRSRGRTRLAPVSLLLTVLATAAHSGTTGKLAGRVVDEGGRPIAGANIRIEGQRLGALADEAGEFIIIGIPAGTHAVTADLIGHAPFRADGVAILPDFTTTVDVVLKTQAVAMAGVTVEAERPLLQKDATGTTRFLSGDDLQKMPVRGYRDGAALQTGVVDYRRPPTQAAIFFESGGVQNQSSLVTRGGRPNETAYYVDGFSQQDPLTGTSSTAISNNAIEEVVVLTGGFAPEYGRVMSGAVNVITREGGDRYFGAVEVLTDNLGGAWVGARKTDYNVYDVSLGGPVLPGRDDLTFYVSAERRWERDRSPSFISDDLRRQLASGTGFGAAVSGQAVLPGERFDPDFKPNNSSSVHTLQAKLAWRLNDQMTLKAGGLGSRDEWREYVHAMLFDADHMPRHLDRNVSLYGTLHHALNARSFYSIGVNHFATLSKTGDGVFFDDLTGYAGTYQPSPPPAFDLDLPIFFLPNTINGPYYQRRSSYVGVQGQFTSQVGPHHQIKVGGDFQRHMLRRVTVWAPATYGGPTPAFRDLDNYGYDVQIDHDPSGNVTGVRLVEVDGGLEGAKHPKTFSLFAQDKFEREGMIVNGGLRLDYLNVDTPSLRSDRAPLGDPADLTNNPDSLEAQDLQKSRTYTRLSPRLGVAFPVTERTILRFNYGQFYQQPNLRDLYVSYHLLQYVIRTHPYFVPFGNPNLRPERTTAYEIGVARQLTDHLRVDLTAYYKGVKDLVQIVSVPGTSVSLYRNRDFATIRGLDFGLTLRPVRHVGASFAYSLSTAQATGSSSTSQFRVAWLGGNVPKETAPVDFDQRHKLSLNVDWALASGEGPRWFGRLPLQDTRINLIFQAASGTPYTPFQVYNEVGLIVASTRPAGPVNSRYGPWTSSLDLKASRGFPVAGLRLEGYVWALNLLNRRNAVDVYRSSGSASTTNWLSSADGHAYLQTAASRGIDGERLYRLAENDPNKYGHPRLVRFGLRALF